MKKLMIAAMTAAFALTSYVVVAEEKKPTAEQCKKDPKMKGCEQMKKK